MRSATLAVGTIVDLELRQRVRSTAWYVLLGVCAVLLLAVTLLLLATAGVFGREGGPQAVSAIVFFVLLLGTLVTPALSGGAINGDRDAGTLATTQVTLIRGWQLVLGKFLAAWTASLAFLVVALPFLLVAAVFGGADLGVMLTALAVTVLELGVIAAVGVGLSAVIARPIFSVVTTYLVVAALSIGTLVAFGLGGLAFPTKATSTYESYSQSAFDADGNVVDPVCDPPVTTTSDVPTYDHLWGILAANPYVVLADAVPGRYDAQGYPRDAFAAVKIGVRSAQIPQDRDTYTSDCNPSRNTGSSLSSTQILERTVPTWTVGLLIHLVLALAALLAAVRAVRTPARRLARGTRIA
ncbi:ABC transporter permease [uncultured Amnibacterium sp.]|uniref:ABC transporter permease n=1 Tax=uncultured Amnibacterium sp. TaxID=1631851 RepID=UPI0035CBA322